jgi:hypothetical protein
VKLAIHAESSNLRCAPAGAFAEAKGCTAASPLPRGAGAVVLTALRPARWTSCSSARTVRPIAAESSNLRCAPAGAFAEAKGFEPLVGCPTAVFKTAAFDHSATLPRAEMAEFTPLVKGLAALQRSTAPLQPRWPKPLPALRLRRSPLRGAVVLAALCLTSCRVQSPGLRAPRLDHSATLPRAEMAEFTPLVKGLAALQRSTAPLQPRWPKPLPALRLRRSPLRGAVVLAALCLTLPAPLPKSRAVEPGPGRRLAAGIALLATSNAFDVDTPIALAIAVRLAFVVEPLTRIGVLGITNRVDGGGAV